MTTSFPGFSSPGASTEVPLEMLAACHERILGRCSTLQRLAEHLPLHGCDADARSAAGSLKRYFNTAAVQHHADEEQDLFPALLESMAGSDAVCIRDLTTALSDEHRMLERQWRRLEAVLDQLERGEASALPADAVSGFINLYQSHIQREEDELLPMAARLLGDQDIHNIGLAMRKRRGIADID